MLLLQTLDAAQRFASFLVVSGDSTAVREDFARMAEIASGLGYRDLQLHFATAAGRISQLEAYVGCETRTAVPASLGPPLAPESAPTALAAPPGLHLIGRLENGRPFYDLDLHPGPDSLLHLDAALGLMLGTWRGGGEDLEGLRVALFEICSHLVEHAEAVRLDPERTAPERLQLVLRFRDEGVQGWIRDDAPPFDPSVADGCHLRDSALAARRGAGSGPGWFCRLLDEYEHEIDGEGNRIGFSKRIAP
jgi:hypothetical protein